MTHFLRAGARLPALAALLLSMAAVAGCGSGDPENTPTGKKLKGVANLYVYIATSKKGQGPASEAEFKKFVKEVPDVVLGTNNIEVPAGGRDQLFVSDRDGQPFVIRYGVSIQGMSATSAPVVAHEKAGKDGKVLIVYANSKVAELNESEVPK